MRFESFEPALLEHSPEGIEARWVLAGARARAEAMASGDQSTETRRVALAVYLSEALTGLWLDRDWNATSVAELLGRVADESGVPVEPLTLDVAGRLLRDPGLLQLPPAVAVEAQLRRLLALSQVAYASLWVLDESQGVTRVTSVGADDGTDTAETVAAHLLGTRRSGAGDERYSGVSVLRWQQPYAALVTRAGHVGRSLALMHEAAAMLGPLLERDALLHRNAAIERRLAESAEQRVERVALDLHDRPVQDVVALAQDVRYFREQLGDALASHANRDLVVGRVDDIEARLAALHFELREICESLASPRILQRPLAELLEREADAIEDRSQIEVHLAVSGDVDWAPASHRMTIVRVVQEALSNAAEHSGAERIEVTVSSRTSYIEVAVLDNGCGFDVNPALVSAAERGRLGLVGIAERARLLGGTCDIRSRPGGPTEVTVALPRFDDTVGAPSAAAPRDAAR